MEKVKIRIGTRLSLSPTKKTQPNPKQKTQNRKSQNITKKMLWRNICQCAYTVVSCNFQTRYEEPKLFFLALNISKIILAKTLATQNLISAP